MASELESDWRAGRLRAKRANPLPPAGEGGAPQARRARALAPDPSASGRGGRFGAAVSASTKFERPVCKDNAGSVRTACAVVLAFAAQPALAGEWDVGGEISGEVRAFPRQGLYPGQFQHWQPSLAVQPDIRWASGDQSLQLVLVPFVRVDAQDERRTHADLREGYIRYNKGSDWSLTVGAAKVFWGRAESRHLVDIVNQTDAIEDIDEEDKLGQPMVNLSLYNDWGKVDLFVMSGFRDRTFPGRDGRLRFGIVVDDERAIFEAEARRKAPDVAARYSHYLGDFDFGVALFHGTSREPRLAVDAANARLLPVYDRITQASLDLQLTRDAWLWKAEAIWREGHGDGFFAAVAGVEYTLYQLFDSNADLGLLAEYLHDGREDGFIVEGFADASALGPLPVSAAPFTAFENDIFAGARLALNDPQDASALAGVIVDASDGTTAMSIEAQRRVGASWTVELEARLFLNVDPGNVASAFRDDDFAALRLTRHF
jgi:hypothetical protein